VSDDRVGGPTVREGNAALAYARASDTPSVASRATSGGGRADRIEEARVANELKRLNRWWKRNKLSETSFADAYQSKILSAR